jgi:hypothetical protein
VEFFQSLQHILKPSVADAERFWIDDFLPHPFEAIRQIVRDALRDFNCLGKIEDVEEPEYVVPVFLDVAGVRMLARSIAAGRVKKSTRPERNDEGQFDDGQAVDDCPALMDEVVIGVIQKDCRQARNFCLSPKNGPDLMREISGRNKRKTLSLNYDFFRSSKQRRVKYAKGDRCGIKPPNSACTKLAIQRKRIQE